MSVLDQLAGRVIVKALLKIGYIVIRQKGSHIRLRNTKSPGRKPVTVPDHKVVGRGLVQKIIRDADLSTDGFIKLVK